MKPLQFFLLLTLICIAWLPCKAEEHVIAKGETCLQIAIDHDLTMAQLQQLNPDADLEMMFIGDILIIPDEGVSFADFLARRYAEVLQVTADSCEITADGAALCFLLVENISDSPLFEVQISVNVRGQNGFTARAAADIPLMQILPGEKLPMAVVIPGSFDAVENTEIRVENLTISDKLQSSFRIPDALFTHKESFPPDRVSGRAAIEFSQEAAETYREKKINVLAAAYDDSGTLVAVRSLYTAFYPRLDITLYSNNRTIDSIELRLEAY